MPAVYHYSPSIARRDAIGYSLTFLHKKMLAAGVRSFLVCDVHAVGAAPPFTMSVQEFEALRPGRDDVLMFHYSFLDQNAYRLMALPCRKIMVYHNITPGYFFRAVGQSELADVCDKARDYLSQMRGAFDAAVGDSAYNAAELSEAGFSNPKVVPVFYNGAFYASGDSYHEDFLKRRLANEISMVFIGRFVHNKQPDELIKVAAIIKNQFGYPVRLRLHGKVWDQAYFNWLRRLSEELGVAHEISFEINQPQSALRTSLASADAFVSVSRHEGFMVPLLEAFSAGCPVVARASSAVTETCGYAGAVVHDEDLEKVAAHVVALYRDREARYDLIRRQSRRALDFSAEATLRKWDTLLHDFIDVSLV